MEGRCQHGGHGTKIQKYNLSNQHQEIRPSKSNSNFKKVWKTFYLGRFFFVILNPCWLTRVHKRMSLLCSILAEFSFTAKSCLIFLPSQEYFHCIAPRNHILKVKRSWSNVCSTRRLVWEQTSLSAEKFVQISLWEEKDCLRKLASSSPFEMDFVSLLY